MQRLKWQNARNSSIKNNYSSKNEIEKKIPHAFTISADNRIHGTFLSTLFICLESISFERIFPFSHSLVYAEKNLCNVKQFSLYLRFLCSDQTTTTKKIGETNTDWFVRASNIKWIQ